MNPRIRSFAALASSLALALPALALAQGDEAIPARPERLRYGPLEFELPRAEELRHELPGGVVAYVVPDPALPLVNIVLHLRTGAFREPAEKPGLAGLTARLMRVGGTANRTPEELDEAADFLAAQIAVSSGDTSARASLNVLTSGLDEGLDLLFDVLRNPRFDEGRLEVEKAKALEAMKQRNDDAGDIQSREWSWLLYGRDHFSSRLATAAELASIRRTDLVDFHRRTWGSQGMVIAVSGDVDPPAIVAELGRRLEGFRAAEEAAWPPVGPEFTPTPGLYRVEKEIPQGKVSVGHRSIRVTDWSSPDIYALSVMNDILGGGGFTSRLVQRVRSDEGLAYGAGSSFGLGAFWPTTFSAAFASKSPTVAYALEIVLEEIEKIRNAPVSEEELRVAKSSFVETFPRSFESASQIAATFSQDDILGRPHDYWYAYRKRIEAVGIDDVKRVAERYLKPAELVLLVVGKWSEIAPGDPQGRATMAQFAGGRATELPLRDPLTLEPIGD
ncbi:MAG TPA: pitrilysin family protein [Thermoanaerobaculia bacterium]|nr:pitrilysin family protein [Thermoanaerobaculia bacterium]